MLKYMLWAFYILAILIFTTFMLSSCATLKKDQAQIESIVHDATDEVITDIVQEVPVILNQPPLLPEFKAVETPISYPLEIGVCDLKNVA